MRAPDSVLGLRTGANEKVRDRAKARESSRLAQKESKNTYLEDTELMETWTLPQSQENNLDFKTRSFPWVFFFK